MLFSSIIAHFISLIAKYRIFQFGNNVAKFILSIGPQTTKEKGVFQIDLDDDAVQNMLISYNGEARYPGKTDNP